VFQGCGTVFELTPSPGIAKASIVPWNEIVLHLFTGGSDGGNPQGNLTFDQSGNMYGTAGGGGNQNCWGGCGVIYKLSPSDGGWTETVLYPFQGKDDGMNPGGGVVFDSSGNLYGESAGAYGNGYGAIYQLSPSGSDWTEQIIYTFTANDDGFAPAGGLIVDSSGNLYGTTASGGHYYHGGGTVFQLTPRSDGGWTFTTLYRLSGERNCGPKDRLFMDASGNLYGTTYCDGDEAIGSVFKLTPSDGNWTYTSLHDFTGGSDGLYPRSGVILDAKGDLYGTASGGGTYNYGLVWQITP